MDIYEDLNRLYEEYQTQQAKKENLKKIISTYYEENKEELDYLLGIYNVLNEKRYHAFSDEAIYYNKLIDKFIKRNHVLNGYINMREQQRMVGDGAKDIEHKFEMVLKPFMYRCAILNDDDRIKLMDFSTQSNLDITNLGEDKINLIIKILKENSAFIGTISKNDIPLVMNTLHIHESYDFDNIDPWERHCIEEGIPREINRDLEYAHKYDEEELDDHMLKENLDNTIERLEKNKDKISEERYYHQYFTLKIVRDRHVEDMYLNTPDEYKKYFIDALTDLMNSGFITSLESEKHNFRGKTYVKVLTASSIVNEEVKKRRLEKKNI